MASPIVGYPRMGPKRELKFALESFWDGKSSAGDLQKVIDDIVGSIVNPSFECLIVPELVPDVKFSYASHKAVREYKKAKALGVDTVPVLLGPVSSLLLYKSAKGVEESFSLLPLLGKILPIYKEVITELKEAGASCILVEERALATGLGSHKSHAFTEAYSALEATLSGLDVLIADIHAEQYKTLTSLKGVTVPKAVAAFKGSDHRHATNIHTHIRHFNFFDTSHFHSTIDMDDFWAIPTQRLIAARTKKKLDKLLKCDHKWGPGQRCGGLKFFRIEETKGDTEDHVRYLPIEPNEEIGISPPAINRSPKTMNVKMKMNGHEYTVLIDTGSNYNFFQPRVAREAGLDIIKDDPIQVCIADGSIMCSEGRCPEFEFVIQGGQFTTEAYIIQLGGCDVILGIQWLMGLGPIIWDFASLKMELTQGGKTIQIIGMDTEDSEAGCSTTDEQLLSVVREGVKDGAGIGPGVYDIHSPRVPSTEEIADGINKMLAVLETIQVNPDCGQPRRLSIIPAC